MNSKNTRKSESLETEIVIVGGGGSGLSAAISAVENGARVLVLENRKTPGGNTLRPEALFAVESPVQKRANVDAGRDEFFLKDLDYAHYKTNPRIINAMINKSGDTVRWLEEMGVEINLYPLSKSSKMGPLPRVGHCPVGGGRAVVKALVNRCEELGIRILYETSGKKILKDKSGKICGVLASAEGKQIEIKAKSVIIATGGYAGNKRLLKKYCPPFALTASLHGYPNMGDGLLMAIEIGAATEGLGVLHLSGPYFPWRQEIWPFIKEPFMVWVNTKGERFVDEAIGNNHFLAANPVSRQPGSVAFSLFDTAIKETFQKKGYLRGLGLDYPPGRTLPDLDEMLKVQIENDKIKVSDSWDDIATWIGAEPGVLKATIDEYNSSCDRGRDDVFRKDSQYLVALHTPPYYAAKTCLRITTTIGGIKINQNMNVLDQQDDPIPGLYSVGVDVGGWETDTYNLTLPGKAFAFAINSGRIAGEYASAYVKTKKR